MKRTILAAVLAGISSTIALAADMGAPGTYTKAPAIADPVYNWTGFYIGGDVGGADVHRNFTSNFSQQDNNPNLANNVQDNSPSGTSFIGGAHAGYNWQFAPNLLVGVEGDWQSLRSSLSFCRQTDQESLACSDGSNVPNFGPRGFASVGEELDWVATARARLGWTMDRLLIYGTGGAAFANVKSSLALDCGNGCGDSGNPVAATANSSSQKTGWVLGAGAEWMLTRNWIIRGEYQHIDLGSLSLALSPDGCAAFSCSLSAKQNVRLDILRAGFSYKFGG